MPPGSSSTEITLAFDEFGWEELSSEAEAAGITIEALIERAVSQFVRSLSFRTNERLALDVPDSSRVDGSAKPASAVVRLSGDQFASVKREADRQEVPVARLVEHAAFLYLAHEGSDGDVG